MAVWCSAAAAAAASTCVALCLCECVCVSERARAYAAAWWPLLLVFIVVDIAAAAGWLLPPPPPLTVRHTSSQPIDTHTHIQENESLRGSRRPALSVCEKKKLFALNVVVAAAASGGEEGVIAASEVFAWTRNEPKQNLRTGLGLCVRVQVSNVQCCQLHGLARRSVSISATAAAAVSKLTD